MKFDRFEFEQAIMNVWAGNDDLKILLEAFVNEENEDEIVDLINGIKVLQKLKFEKLWAMFEAGVEQKRIL